MCVVSNVGDFYRGHFPNTYPSIQPNQTTLVSPVDRAEFDKLKRDVEEMKDLLKKASEIDRKTGQPNCEMEDKIKFLREVAKLVGVDITDALK